MLPAPNTFEPAPNIISKIPKIPFISKMKIRIENNAFWKNKFVRDFCVSDIKVQKKKSKSHSR